MSGSLYLAWRYLCQHKGTTAILVASVTLITFLPAALEVIVNNAAEHFRSRAVSTPLIVGARGSPLELVLGTLYFDKQQPGVLRMSQVERIAKSKLANPIPMHVRFRARGYPIVGTTAAYLKLRDLQLVSGRTWKMLGECVVGSRVAAHRNLRLGSRIPVSTKKVFSLDDAPLRLNVVGILAATETPDDEAILVDLKTTWIIEGLGHGHAKGAKHGSPEAAVYTDITKENVGHFHFHGDQSSYPITAIIAVPEHKKAETLLIGQYLSPEDTAQIVRPSEVMDSLLAKILMVRSYMIAIVGVVSLVTLSTMALVIVLSIRLRQREISTISKMGCSRFAIASILGSQILIILAISALASTGLTLLTATYGRELIRLLVF